jgi:hypothetical protein
MIRIHRGAEPSELTAARTTELPRVQAIAVMHRPTQEELGRRYEVARDALWHAQRYKCCYCESREQSKRNDVEHFRPKTRADRRPGAREDHGYWWLAWSWENLLFSSGIEHIQFVWMSHGPLATGKWLPRPRNGSPRGAATIKVCMLDRPDLLDLYGHHVEQHVIPMVEDIRSAIRGGSGTELQRQWSRTLLRLLNPAQVYIGLSHDALDHFIPAVVRKKHQLELRLPSR